MVHPIETDGSDRRAERGGIEEKTIGVDQDKLNRQGLLQGYAKIPPPLCDRRVQGRLQLPIAPPESFPNPITPRHIFPLLFQRPLHRWCVQETAEVRNLIGDLHQLGALGEMPGMDNLQPLPLCRRELLIVCDFFHDPSDLHAEVGVEFGRGGLGVLQRIVENGCLEGHDIGHPTFPSKQLSDFDEVIDIGRSLGPFAPLITVFVCSKVEGF